MASLSGMAAAKGRAVENNALASVKVQQIHYSRLHPSELNFYGQREVEEMADSIAMAGILQPLIVRKTDMGEYEVIVGHKRRLAAIMNVERGMKDCEFLPCIEIKASDKIIQEIRMLSNLTDKEAEDIYVRYVLMVTNSTQRELNDYERMMQAMEYKEIIPYMRGDAELKGRALRTEIAKEMKRSTGQIGTYESIYNNLIPEGMERFRNEEIGISVAAGLASLPGDIQKRLVDRQDLKIADIEKEKELLSGAVSESDTEKVPQNPVNTKCGGSFGTVSESDTEKMPQDPVNTKCGGSFGTVSESDTEKMPQDPVNTKCGGSFETVPESDAEKAPAADKGTADKAAYTLADVQNIYDRQQEIIRMAEHEIKCGTPAQPDKEQYKEAVIIADGLTYLLEAFREGTIC